MILCNKAENQFLKFPGVTGRLPRLNSTHEQWYNVPLPYLPIKSFNVFFDFYQFNIGQTACTGLFYWYCGLDLWSWFKKNPAYGRHWISQPMRIVAPTFLFLLATKKGLIAYLFRSPVGRFSEDEKRACRISRLEC